MGLALYSDAPLSSELLHFTNIVDRLDTPEKVLDALHDHPTQYSPAEPFARAGLLSSITCPAEPGL